mgnify:CR=1 FL=1
MIDETLFEAEEKMDKAVEVARQIKGVKRVEASGLKLASR